MRFWDFSCKPKSAFFTVGSLYGTLFSVQMFKAAIIQYQNEKWKNFKWNFQNIILKYSLIIWEIYFFLSLAHDRIVSQIHTCLSFLYYNLLKKWIKTVLRQIFFNKVVYFFQWSICNNFQIEYRFWSNVILYFCTHSWYFMIFGDIF